MLRLRYWLWKTFWKKRILKNNQFKKGRSGLCSKMPSFTGERRRFCNYLRCLGMNPQFYIFPVDIDHVEHRITVLNNYIEDIRKGEA